jgi:4-amino-4-deoxy-L-arabinose transferase-like glycosyltransferase
VADATEKNESFDWRKRAGIAAALALCALILYLLPLFQSRAIYETPEARIAVVAREMIERDNYIEPTLAGKTRLNKPPLPYYLAVLVTKAISNSTSPDLETLKYATLLPQAIFGALAVFIVALYGMAVFGTSGGILSGAILGFSMMPARYAQLGYPDVTLMCACAGVTCASAWIICTPQPSALASLGLGVSMAGAVLIKEPILALVMPGPILAECILRRKVNWRKVALFALGCAIALLIIAPWYLLVIKTVPNGLQILIDERRHIWVAGHDTKAWWFYITELSGAFLPWTPALLVAVALAANLRPTDAAESLVRSHFRYFLLTGLIGFAGFYSQAKQQGYYLLPLAPAFALTSGYALTRCRPLLVKSESGLGMAQIVVALLIGIAICLEPQWEKGIPLLLAVFMGVVFIATQVLCVRYWRAGRASAATLAAAIAALLCLVPYPTAWLSARSHRRLDTIEKSAARVRTELDALGSGVRVYGWGNPQPLLNYYMGRVVGNQKELQSELSKEEKDSPNSPRRVLVATAKWTRAAGLEQYLPPAVKPDDNSTLLVVPLPPTAELIKTMKTAEHPPPEDDE